MKKPAVYTLFGVVLMSGCAKPVMELPKPNQVTQERAQTTLRESNLVPPRNSRPEDMYDEVYRVVPEIRASAHRACIGLELPKKNCDLVHTAKVSVWTNRSEVNAYADRDNNIGMYGGLVKNMGTDDEIAAVLAHEFSHIMLGHIEKKMRNVLLGMLAGAGVAAAFSYQGVVDEQLNEDLMRLGMEVGSRAYSPAMELEADRTAMYILKDAGFETAAMGDVIVRMERAQSLMGRARSRLRIGFLRTHPTNQNRMAHLVAGSDAIRSGEKLKTKEQSHEIAQAIVGFSPDPVAARAEGLGLKKDEFELMRYLWACVNLREFVPRFEEPLSLSNPPPSKEEAQNVVNIYDFLLIEMGIKIEGDQDLLGADLRLVHDVACGPAYKENLITTQAKRNLSSRSGIGGVRSAT